MSERTYRVCKKCGRRYIAFPDCTVDEDLRVETTRHADVERKCVRCGKWYFIRVEGFVERNRIWPEIDYDANEPPPKPHWRTDIVVRCRVLPCGCRMPLAVKIERMTGLMAVVRKEALNMMPERRRELGPSERELRAEVMRKGRRKSE
jgi:hypothetical protein